MKIRCPHHGFELVPTVPLRQQYKPEPLGAPDEVIDIEATVKVQSLYKCPGRFPSGGDCVYRKWI